MHKSGVSTSSGERKAYVIQYSKTPLVNLEGEAVIENKIPLTWGGVSLGH